MFYVRSTHSRAASIPQNVHRTFFGAAVSLHLSGPYQVPIRSLLGPYRRSGQLKSAEVVRKMSLCKHKRLPARRVYSLKHTAKCFNARLFRYHLSGPYRSSGQLKSAEVVRKMCLCKHKRVCPDVADASTPSGQSQLPTEVDNNVRK